MLENKDGVGADALLRPQLDHVVIAARSLAEGVAWVESLLGVKMLAGGRHVNMGTHNALLGLGPDCYLEVIAIDPESAALSRPRWFALDAQQTLDRMRENPFLLHWVARVGAFPLPGIEVTEIFGPVTPMSRGELNWEITIPVDGSLPGDGCLPSLIKWPGGRSPASRLPDSGWRLQRLDIYHPVPHGLTAILVQLGIESCISLINGEEVRLHAVLSNDQREVVI